MIVARSWARELRKAKPPLDSIPNDVLLESQGLGRRHPNGADWLLSDVSLSVRPGDRLAIVGPSGAGKTLLLRALAQLDRFDAGQLLWHGAPVLPRAVPEFRSRAVYLHQRPALFDGSVEFNLQMPFSLSVHADKRFDREWLVERLQSVGRDPDFLGRNCRDLSGGEAQIVSLLRALQLKPLLLLLDEPTASLDAQAVEAAERLVAAWGAGDATRALVWVSHSTDQARRVAQRTLSMRSGRIDSES